MSNQKKINKVARKYGVMLASCDDGFYVWVASDPDGALQKSICYVEPPPLIRLAEDLKKMVKELRSGENKIYDEFEEE